MGKVTWRECFIVAFFIGIIGIIAYVTVTGGSCGCNKKDDKVAQQQTENTDQKLAPMKDNLSYTYSSSPLGSDDENPINAKISELKLVYVSKVGGFDEMAGKVVKPLTLMEQSLLRLSYMVVQRYGDNKRIIVLADAEYRLPYNNIVTFKKVVGNDGTQFYMVIKDDPNVPTEALPENGQAPVPVQRAVEPKDVQYPPEAMPDIIQREVQTSAE